jgi:hypothetical protein
LPGSNGQPDNIAETITEVSERVTALVHDQIELAKAEMVAKATSIARGAAAVAIGAVFGVYAILFFLVTVALALNALLVTGFGDVWLGFLIVLGLLTLLMVAAFLFAYRKFQVGAPTPTMALDEAKKTLETIETASSPETASLPPGDES